MQDFVLAIDFDPKLGLVVRNVPVNRLAKLSQEAVAYLDRKQVEAARVAASIAAALDKAAKNQKEAKREKRETAGGPLGQAS